MSPIVFHMSPLKHPAKGGDEDVQSDKWVSQMRRGMVDFCLLAALRQRDDYGYAIIERLGENPALIFTESTVYPALARMTREGLLRSYRHHDGPGPPRRYYALSEDGHAQLQAMSAYWSEFNVAIDALLSAERER